MPGPLVLFIPIIIKKLVGDFLKKYCIKKLGKPVFYKTLRESLFKSIQKLPRNQYTNRLSGWIKKATDEELEYLLSPEEIVWNALTDIIKGKTNKLEVQRTTPESLLKDNKLVDETSEGRGLLGKEEPIFNNGNNNYNGLTPEILHEAAQTQGKGIPMGTLIQGRYYHPYNPILKPY